MRSCIIIATLIWGVFLPLDGLYSQISTGGTPPSFSHPDYFRKAIKVTKLPAVNMKKVWQEDEQHPGNSRFTTPILTDFNLDNSGRWTELDNGDRIWQIKIRSGKALALMVLYDQFYLPPGAQLFMYNEYKTQILGAYTSRNNRQSRQFMTGLIDGETAIIEYFEPKVVKDQGFFRIFRVDHAYQKNNLDAVKSSTDLGFGAADICNVNVNCPQADNFDDQKRSVCRIYEVLAEGIGFCSGTLVNNTSMDGRPYVLSAYHCQDGYTPLYDLWRFDFNYQGSGCLNPFQEPDFNSMLGCERRAGRQENDFLLLEITSTIPNAYDVYLSGWDRTGVPPDTSVTIHHPRGDIKKFSRIDQQATIHPFPFEWDNGTVTPPNLNFRTIFTLGTFEGGSSGSPLLNKEGYVIGQLHGGFIHCEGSVGYFGRLSESWEGGGTPETRLKDWLDPENTEVLTFDGVEHEVSGSGIIAGYVTNENGIGIKNAEIHLTGARDTMVMTDEEGYYEFSNLPFGGIYEVSLSKDVNARNGVSTFDLVKITQHIIGASELDSPYKMLAADVNNSGTISTLDLIMIRRLILSIDLEFANVPSWIFLPWTFEFDDPTNPFNSTVPNSVQVTSFSEDIIDLDFMGIKMGDVNISASPSG